MSNDRALVVAAMLWVVAVGAGRAQEHTTPTLRAGELPEDVQIDGGLDEPAWQSADTADALTRTDPSEGAPPSARTIVRVLASRKAACKLTPSLCCQ